MTYFICKILRFLKAFFLELLPDSYVVKMSAYYNVDGSLQKLNWGDDINVWFLSEIVSGRVLSYDWSLLTRFTAKPYVLGIGSLLTLVPLNNTIVWGTGVLSSTAPFRGKPREIRAVRGPLSRNRLLDAGITCPSVYGDPALLLPRYYTPEVQKKYTMGIIPHYKDQNSKILSRIKSLEDVIVISPRGYDHWLDFVDQICQCEAILSSSLHGLIVSEAYGIPNVWVKFDDQDDDDIKFHDFFLSLGTDREAVLLNDVPTLEEISSLIKSYEKGSIDLQPLIDACPFKLKDVLITRG